MTLPYKEIKIDYSSVGNGKTLVFLHGFLENQKMWEDIIPNFTTQYHCITLDLLGHGNTPCIGYIHTMEDMARQVKAVLNNLDINEAIFIGHSMGGYVSLAFLDMFPELVSGLVLLNSTSYADSEDRRQNRARAINIVKKNPAAFTNMAIANLFAADNRDNFVSEIEKIKEQASKTSLQGIIAALEGMKVRKDRQNVFRKFDGAKVILAGIKDPVLSYDQNCEEAKKNAVSLITFRGGHMTHIELYFLIFFLTKYC